MNPTRDTFERLVKILNEKKPLKGEYQQALDKKIRLEFNYNSNHIEGNTLTYGETELLIIFDKTTGNHEMREYEEMKSHDVAFELIKEWAVDIERPLTEMAIKNLHEILLVKPYWKKAQTPDGQSTRRLITVGDYKEQANSVRLQNGEVFNYTSPEETPIQMGELIQWYRNEEIKNELHATELAALFHYKFVRIHPFDDGNGRLSRLLMNYILFKNDLPPIIIKSADKKNYLFALNQADTGNLGAFVKYIETQMVWSLELSIKAANGESLEEPEDLDKKLNLLKRKLGHKGEEVLESKYSLEIIEKLIEGNVSELAKEWDRSIKKFESFFVSKEAYVDFVGHRLQGADIHELLQIQINNSNIKGMFKERPTGIHYRRIMMTVNFNKLLKEKENHDFPAGSVEYHFYNNAYEVNYTGAKHPLHKRYNEILSESEINEIVSGMANELYSRIEQVVDVNK